MPKIALSPEQEEEVMRWLRSGMTIQAAHERATASGWKVSQARVGQLRQLAERPGAAAAPAAGAEGAIDVVALALRVTRLEQRLEAMQAPPQEDLKQASVGAVVQCRRLSQDPGVDDRVKVMALDKLPKLIELAMRVTDGDDDAVGLFTPEKPA